MTDTPDTNTPARAQDAREPLREMDYRIAKLLGLNAFYEPDNEYFTDSREWVEAWVIIEKPHYRCYELPYYTTDTSDAMYLVKQAQPAYFTLSYSPDRLNWRAEFSVTEFDEIKFADAREPAEAICHAWLQHQERTATPPAAGDD